MCFSFCYLSILMCQLINNIYVAFRDIYDLVIKPENFDTITLKDELTDKTMCV